MTPLPDLMIAGIGVTISDTMRFLIGALIATSGLVFGQLQNFGNASDPDEKKRSERMISHAERGNVLSEQMVKQQGTAIAIAKFALAVSLLSLVVSLIAIFLRH